MQQKGSPSMNHTMSIVTEADTKEILDIYAPYITDTVITYEYEIPTLKEFQTRIRDISSKFPYIVYRIGARIVGYAYASPFKTRAAFSWDVETSIYIHPDYQHAGIGSKLYKALIALLKEQGYYHLYAYITYPHDPSIRFHESLGFTKCAMYEKTGYKLGAWRDLVCMDLSLVTQEDYESAQPPLPCLPITAIPKELIHKILTENM